MINFDRINNVVNDALKIYLKRAKEDLIKAKKIEQEFAEQGAAPSDLIRAFDLVWECEAVVEEIEKQLALRAMREKCDE